MSEIMYEQNGDYLIPNIIMDEEPMEPVTKYGTMRNQYVKKHKDWIRGNLLARGTYRQHLLDVQHQAEQMKETLVTQMMEKEGVTEALKEEDWRLWILMMDAIEAEAEAIVIREVIQA